MRAKAVKGLVPEDRNRFGWLNRELARQTFATKRGEPDPSLARWAKPGLEPTFRNRFGVLETGNPCARKRSRVSCPKTVIGLVG